MKRFRLLFLFFTLYAFAFSQHQTNADSLKDLIAKMPDDSLKAKSIIKLSMNLISTGKYDDAEVYLKQLAIVSEQHGFPKGVGVSYNYRGIICDDRGQSAMALENYFKAQIGRAHV